MLLMKTQVIYHTKQDKQKINIYLTNKVKLLSSWIIKKKIILS